MASTINTTLDQRPKALNGVRVNDTTSVDFGGVFNPLMGVSELLYQVVAAEFIGIDFGVDVRRGLLPQDRQEGTSLDVGYYLAHYLPVITLYNAHDRRFLLKAATFAGRLPTYVGFIHFQRARNLVVLFIHELAYHGEHSPSRLVSNSNFTLKLFSRDTAASGGHQEHGVKPVAKRGRRLMEDSSGEGANLITTELAGINGLALYPVMRRYLLALHAVHAVRISPLEYSLKASIIGRIFLVKVFKCVFRRLHFRLQSQLSNRSITQNVRDVKGYLPNIACIFMATGIEFPEAIEFARSSANNLGFDLQISTPDMHLGGLFDRLEHFGWPTIKRTWCSRDLKIRPQNKLLRRLYGKGEYYKMVGVRKFESSRRKKMHTANRFIVPDYNTSHDYMVYPILQWSSSDVLRYLEMKKLPTSGLYHKYTVSGCYWCPFYQPSIYKSIMRDMPDLYDEFISWEIKLNSPSVNGHRWLRDIKKEVISHRDYYAKMNTRDQDPGPDNTQIIKKGGQ